MYLFFKKVVMKLDMKENFNDGLILNYELYFYTAW